MTSTKSILTKSKDWTSFKRTVDALDNKQKGDAFEDLAQHFFQIDPKYRTKLKNVWNVNKREVPSRINRKLNLFSLDLGIDLLAETNEGEFWAIQCKYHSDQSKSLTKSEIDSCMNLAFGHCEGISLAVICTSAEKYSRNLRGFAEEKLTYCDGSVWRALDENFFKAVRKNLKGQSQPIKALKPRPHQKRAIKNALDHFVTKKNERGKMIMPCGSGKSLTGYWIADKFKAKKILVAVPSLALIKQTLEVWAEQSVANKKNVRWICVCSDKSVGNISNDDVAVQLQDLGIRIHTKPAEIASWLKKRSPATTVVFTTYHSGEAIAAASKKAKYSFDLGICDEAHKTVGAGGNAFSHLLYEKNIKVKRRLFMTATERRYGGSADKVISMDDHDLYGETFELLSFKEALECKPAILSDYKIITIGVTQQEIRENIRKNILVKPSKGAWNEETEIQMLTAALALRKAIKLKGIKHAVSFHSSIARAEAFRETQDKLTKHMKGYDRLDTFHVSGKLPTADREKILDEFAKSKRSLITNARCLTEGVDVKQIDCVVFADPKKSAVDIVQAVGRALRPYEGKKYGYVIVPQLIDAKSVKGRIEQNESFKDILMTLRALAANDERIVEYFRSVSKGKKIPKRITPIEFVTPVGTEIDYKQFEDDLKLKVWGRLAKLSWRPFEEAREFVLKLGLSKEDDWRIYCKNNNKFKLPILPMDIPKTPQTVYKLSGWKGLGDWLGTGNIAPQNLVFLSFSKAKKHVQKLRLKSTAQWADYCKGKLSKTIGLKPDNIPAAPMRAYKMEWTSMGDWLGTGYVSHGQREYLAYNEAKSIASDFQFKSHKEYGEWHRNLPSNNEFKAQLPLAADYVYKEQKKWIGWDDFLGKSRRQLSIPKQKCVKYDVAKKRVAKYNFKDAKAYLSHYRTHDDLKSLMVPYSPFQVYKKTGWKGWPDYLGCSNKRNFSDAKKFVKSLWLTGKAQWEAYCAGKYKNIPQRPSDIPTGPAQSYKDEFIDYADWLGPLTSFQKVKNIVKKQNISSPREYNKYLNECLITGIVKIGERLPPNPKSAYKDLGWTDWNDFLSLTVENKKKEYLDFENARRFSRSLKLKNWAEWQQFYRDGKLPDNIPKLPNKYYAAKGWISIGDWLNTGFIATRSRKYKPFKEARKYARKLRLSSGREWREFCRNGKLPSDIPSQPDRVYHDNGWINQGDWLGSGFTATRLRKYRSFKDARKYARNLNLKSREEWNAHYRGGKLPEDIPAKPERTYKNKGWSGVADWLGK